MNMNKVLLSIGEQIVEDIILDPERESIKRYLFGSVDVTVDNWKETAISLVKKAREAIIEGAMAYKSRRTGRWLKSLMVTTIGQTALYSLHVIDINGKEWTAMDAAYNEMDFMSIFVPTTLTGAFISDSDEDEAILNEFLVSASEVF